MTYVPFGLLIEVPQIAAFHKKLDLAGEGSSCNARQKNADGLYMWRTAHSHFLLLAAANAALSC